MLKQSKERRLKLGGRGVWVGNQEGGCQGVIAHKPRGRGVVPEDLCGLWSSYQVGRETRLILKQREPTAFT